MRREYAPQIAAARARRDHDGVRDLEQSEDHELGVLTEEDEARYTRSLLRTARRLRVPVPRSATGEGEPTGYWEQGSQTGARYLTEVGIERLREDIRKELKWRREARAHWLAFVPAVTGILGALIGLAAVLKK